MADKLKGLISIRCRICLLLCYHGYIQHTSAAHGEQINCRKTNHTSLKEGNVNLMGKLYSFTSMTEKPDQAFGHRDQFRKEASLRYKKISLSMDI